MADKLANVGDSTFQQEVLDRESTVVVDFWAEWCGPCLMLGPVIEKLATEFDGRLKFAKLNVDKNPSTPERYGIRGIPTMIVFRGGEEVHRIVGFRPEESLRQEFEEQLQPA